MISIVIGILLLVYPQESVSTIGMILGVVVVLSGLAVLLSQLFDFNKNVMGMVVGLVLIILGIWIFTGPSVILSLIPIAIGVMLVIHGIQDFTMAIEGAKAHMDMPWIGFVIATINIILGFVCIAKAFTLVDLAFRIIGLMMIFDGITDIGLVHRVRKATNSVVDSYITKEEDL